MKIVVVYATAGAGHKKAAQAIESYILSQDPGVDIELIDIISRSSWLFKLIYLWGYDFLINHCQWLWAVIFFASSGCKSHSFFSRITTLIHYYNTRNFTAHIMKTRPDVIVSTHFMPSDVVSFLKESRNLRARLITVITDFGVHPFWISLSTDCYCVASRATRDVLQAAGVDSAKIKLTGIPVDSKFISSHDKQKICKQLAIDVRRPVVLVVTGSFGIGPIEEIVRQLCISYEVMAVCARNEQLYKRLKAKAYANTHVFGFVDFIDDLMAVADVIITKPGGLTISELLCMDLVPLFVSAIPGQEAGNVEILGQSGIGSAIADLASIETKLAQCIRESQRIKEAILTLKQPNAALGIYDVIRTGSSGSAG